MPEFIDWVEQLLRAGRYWDVLHSVARLEKRGFSSERLRLYKTGALLSLRKYEDLLSKTADLDPLCTDPIVQQIVVNRLGALGLSECERDAKDLLAIIAGHSDSLYRDRAYETWAGVLLDRRGLEASVEFMESNLGDLGVRGLIYYSTVLALSSRFEAALKVLDDAKTQFPDSGSVAQLDCHEAFLSYRNDPSLDSLDLLYRRTLRVDDYSDGWIFVGWRLIQANRLPEAVSLARLTLAWNPINRQAFLLIIRSVALRRKHLLAIQLLLRFGGARLVPWTPKDNAKLESVFSSP